MDKNLNETRINTESTQEKEEFVEVKTRDKLELLYIFHEHYLLCVVGFSALYRVFSNEHDDVALGAPCVCYLSAVFALSA